jgi:hypothetical protein
MASVERFDPGCTPREVSSVATRSPVAHRIEEP